MTLREYIEELGFDYEHFFDMELATLLLENGRILGSVRYQSCLDYEIKEIEYHVELERDSSGNDDKCSSYHIITLYQQKEEAA